MSFNHSPSSLRLHECEQPASWLLRVHLEFLVRRGVALPGRLGTATDVADSTGTATLESRRRAATTAVRVSATTAISATEIAVSARAVGRRGQHARAGFCRTSTRHWTLLSSALSRAVETQQERTRGPQPSGSISDPAAATPRYHRHRTDHYQRVKRWHPILARDPSDIKLEDSETKSDKRTFNLKFY